MATQTTLEKVSIGKLLTPTVIVAALGYFVDIYDLILFSIVRIQSLKDIGLSGDQLTEKGVYIINAQMIGMLLGGIIWGVWADKKGRLSVLYGSILLYSVANVANGMVDTVLWYGIWRFIAGIGLAGELGAGITLVAETMPKAYRGLATTIVASVGIAGALLAGLFAETFPWRTCYFIGGGLGLALLFLRIGVRESTHFEHAKHASSNRGEFLLLFRRFDLFKKYIRCILVGLPVWYVVGVLMTFSPEFARSLGIENVLTSRSVALCYGGMVLGDLCSGLASQAFKSRKMPMLFFLLLAFGLSIGYHFQQGVSTAVFYGVCLALGFSVGYWVLFMTMATEQFGTNIRATVTTTVPNFVRGAVVPMTSLFLALQTYNGILFGGLATGAVVFALGIFGWFGLKESFHADLDFLETDGK